MTWGPCTKFYRQFFLAILITLQLKQGWNLGSALTRNGPFVKLCSKAAHSSQHRKQWYNVSVQPKRFNKYTRFSRRIHFWCPLGHSVVCNNKGCGWGENFFSQSAQPRALWHQCCVCLLSRNICSVLSFGAHKDPNFLAFVLLPQFPF